MASKKRPKSEEITDNTPDPVAPTATSTAASRMAENIERIEGLSQRLMQVLAKRPIHPAAIEGPGADLYSAALNGWMRLATEQPARIIEQQVRYWGDTLRHMADAQAAFRNNFAAPEVTEETSRDKRFANPLWQTNPFFSFVRAQYRINSDAMRKAAEELPLEDEVQRRRVGWLTHQMIDMMSPTNFLATNPDALARAVETDGASLVKGLENLVRDLEDAGGEMLVSLVDKTAFEIGRNIATTEGQVIDRQPMYELIQYARTTAKVRQTPIIVFPPWINKFYILDLKAQNSLLRWLVDQGHTLFVVSWKNPGPEQADVGMDDYVSSFISAMDKVMDVTGETQVNAVGYCIAGTTLSATLGLLKQRGDDRVKSATFFTTLTDFSDQGEFTTYLQDDFVGGIGEVVAQMGYLPTRMMQRTFSFLRANDLVWGPAVRSYMLGETPPAFDLLYWNADGTNLPGRMVMEYLRDLCQDNGLARKGFEVLDHSVTLADVTVPLCAIACEGDHIAPWVHSWQGVAQMASTDKTFILSESGHIAGIVNPPGRDKYGHYLSDEGFAGSADAWRAKAVHHKGSWWPDWQIWLERFAGPMVDAREPGQGIEAAPGAYVREAA